MKSPYYRISRSATRVLPIKNFKRSFDSKEILKYLEKILKGKDLKPTGFSPWNPPNLGWMLRVIIALKPEEEARIINFRKAKYTNLDKMLENCDKYIV